MGIRQTPEAKTKGKAQFAGMGLQDTSGGGSYTLPVASASVLGGVKVGSRLSIESDGTLSAADQSTPIATTSVAGKVIPDGSSITVAADGTISASGGDVPIATTSVAGKVKPDGSTITVESDGTISSVDQTPIATTSVAGKVIPDGTSITVQSDGTIAAVGGSSYTLPAATTTTLGGVIVGSRLTVAADGTLDAADQSTPIATTSVAGKVIPDGTSITVDASGNIAAVDQTPIATTSVAGKVKPDGSSITVDANGVISAETNQPQLKATVTFDNEHTIQYFLNQLFSQLTGSLSNRAFIKRTNATGEVITYIMNENKDYYNFSMSTVAGNGSVYVTSVVLAQSSAMWEMNMASSGNTYTDLTSTTAPNRVVFEVYDFN